MSELSEVKGPSRRRWLIGGVAVAAAAAGVGGNWWREQGHAADPERLGADFWDMRFEQPDGGELRLAQMKGKPLLVNFWATWCPPCVEELPMLDAFYREQAANGWQVVGLAVDQLKAVQKFLERAPLTFPVGLAGFGGAELGRQLGNEGGGLPFTLVVGKDGRIAARKIGQVEPSDLQAWQQAFSEG